MSEYQSDVLVTRGKEGMTIFFKNGDTTSIPPNPMNEFDVTGAGDTILAILGLAYAVGMPLHEAATLANRGEGIVVQKPGTATVSLEELISSVEDNRHIEGVSLVPKIWGYEKWLENSDKYCSKILSLNKGFQCSLHYHKMKDEMFLILKGHVRMEVGDTVSHMREGNFVRIAPETPHRFTGIDNSMILEVSTYHDEGDSYRIQESRKLDEYEFSFLAPGRTI